MAAGGSSKIDPTAFVEQQRQMLREFNKGGDDEKTGSVSKLAVAESSEIGPTFIQQQSQSGETKRQLREETEQNKLQIQLKKAGQQGRQKNEHEENLQRLLTEMEQQLKESNEHKENLQQQLREMKGQLREKNEQEENLQRQLRESEQQLREKNDQKESLQRQLRESEQQLREKNDQKENLQRQLRESEQQLREKNEQEEDLQRQLRGMEQQLIESNEQEEDLQRQLREVGQQLTNCQGQLQEKDLRETSLQEQLREKELEQENSQRRLREMEQRLTNCEEQIREKEDESAHLEQQVTVLERQLGAKDEELNELELSLSTAQQTISEQRRQEVCDWVIPRGEIQMTNKCLGRGGWGSVNEGTYCGCTVAVKQIHELILSPHNRRLFEREMNIASRCRHPCLLQFIGATNDEGSPLFVTELMETSLRALLEQRQLSEIEICVISLDVSRALYYLHQKNIVHRDVSSANVLLWRQGDHWSAKVSDYGTAKFMQQTMTVAPGALIYSAPESLTSNQTDKVS